MLSIVVSPLCILTDFFLITALSGGYYSYSHVSKLRLGNFPKKSVGATGEAEGQLK